MTLWRVEGLLPNPHVWLCANVKVARTCYNGIDRQIVRVATKDLDVSQLQLDKSWYQWLLSYRRGEKTLPPVSLLQWWERLYRRSDRVISARLAQTLQTGTYNWDQLSKDLSGPITKLRKGQLWTYQRVVKPASLSLEWRNWYVALKNPETVSAV